jgi:hypothetical protein
MKVVIAQQTNRVVIESLMKDYEIKQCERFTKNCILMQCFNCHKYEHIEKWCKVLTTCDKCARGHRIPDCDPTIIEQHKRCAVCEERKHVVWASDCKVRMRKKRKIERARVERTRLYIVNDSKTSRFTIITKKEIDAAQKIISNDWTLIKIKKRKMKRASISSTREMIDKIISMILRRSSSDLVQDAVDLDSWTKAKIIKLSNKGKVMNKRSVSRSRFVSRALSVFSIMNDIVHDFDNEIWGTQSS